MCMTQAYPSISATRVSQDFPVLLKTENPEKVTEVPVSSFLNIYIYTYIYMGGARANTDTQKHTHKLVFRVCYESGRFFQVLSEDCCKPMLRRIIVLSTHKGFGRGGRKKKNKLVAELGEAPGPARCALAASPPLPLPPHPTRRGRRRRGHLPC